MSVKIPKDDEQSKVKPNRNKDKPKISRIGAARIIQRFWRQHIDVQVFKYYRDLINFRNRGDPSMMLRCINPVEGKLLDCAAGVHIKFRLAGERFPPNIYYKIFTHRAIQDIGANAPRDYTNADTKRLMARDVHNKTENNTKKQTINTQANTENWYKRTENNGWRLVSDRLLHNAMSDPVTWNSSKKQIDFHHNKLQRREDVEKKRKRKKIDWMQKMYRDGMLQAKAEDAETVALIDGATTGMVSAIKQHGAEAVEEWEVDELLEWTTSLNFDEYVSEWKEIATSAHSELVVEERFQVRDSNTDPYELNVIQQGRYSHNTPVSRLSQSEPSI